MSKGKVQCAGSSLFLKSRFGIGYNLVYGVLISRISYTTYDYNNYKLHEKFQEGAILDVGSNIIFQVLVNWTVFAIELWRIILLKF